MQDQVQNLQNKGIGSTYLGSAQLDKQAEQKALEPDSEINLILSPLNGYQSLTRKLNYKACVIVENYH